MSESIRKLLAQCKVGFTFRQKRKVIILCLLYLISPIDLLPEFLPLLGVCDDIFALYLMVRVLFSPTLPRPSGSAGTTVPAVRAIHHSTPYHSEIIDVEFTEARS